MNQVTFELDNGKRYHAHSEWGLILSKKDIGPPTPQIERESIPGRDGTIDLSEWTGDVRYNDRSITLDLTPMERPHELHRRYSLLNNALLGRKMKLFFSDDPDYYYYGRCESINQTTSESPYMCTIKFTCEPYKYRKRETVISESVQGAKIIVITNDRRPAIPTLTTSATITITYGSMTKQITAGTWTIRGLVLNQGRNEISITGTADITLKYREGAL